MPKQLLELFCVSLKKKKSCWKFYKNCVKSVNCFWKDGHFNIFTILWAWALCFYVSFLLTVTESLKMKVMGFLTSFVKFIYKYCILLFFIIGTIPAVLGIIDGLLNAQWCIPGIVADQWCLSLAVLRVAGARRLYQIVLSAMRNWGLNSEHSTYKHMFHQFEPWAQTYFRLFDITNKIIPSFLFPLVVFI